MSKKVPSILRRVSAAATPGVRAVRRLRAKAKPPAGPPMRWEGSGGAGPANQWRLLLPGSQFDYEHEAGDLWLNSAVASCLGWIKRNFPEPDLEVIRTLPDNAAEVVTDSKLVTLIDRPNAFYDRYSFWAACVLSGFVDGNAYIRKVRDGKGQVIQLWWVPHWLIGPRWAEDGSEYIGWYEYQINGRLERIDVADVIHFRASGRDPRNDRLGFSELKTAVRHVCGLNDCDGYTAAILRNMGIPGLIISSADSDMGFQPEELPVLRGQWDEQFGGEGRGRPLFAPRPLKVEKIAFSPQELALDKIPSRLETAICAAVGLPAMVAGLAAGSEFKTYSNWSESRRAAYEDCLVPLQKAWAECLTQQLLVPDFDEGDRCRWDYSAVQCLQENEGLVAERVGKLYQVSQVIKRSEAREALGYDWTDADEVYYPEAMLRFRDVADAQAQGVGVGGPVELGGDSVAIDVEQVPIDKAAVQALESPGSKKSGTLGHGKVADATAPADAGARSAPDDADDRAMSPNKTHKASSAEAILKHALRGRGWTAAHRDGTLDLSQRHELLRDITDYATDWLRHEAEQFFANYGSDDGRAGECGEFRAEPGSGGQCDRGVESDAPPLGDRDPAPDGERGIAPATALHLSRLFRRARLFTREAHLAAVMAVNGPEPLSAEDLADVETSSRDQESYLDRFLAQTIAAPPAAIDDDARDARIGFAPATATQVVARMGLYGSDLWRRAIDWLRKKIGRKAKATQEMRNLGGETRSCPECPTLAGHLAPIGTLPPVGEQQCNGGCRCWLSYFDADGNEVSP